MSYEIVQASNVAKRAMRKVNKKHADREQLMKQKKYAMRQYRKMINANRRVNMAKKYEDENEMPFAQLAVGATAILTLLSFRHPQVGILAGIFAVILIASVMDSKFKKANSKHKREMANKDKRIEEILKLVNKEETPAAPQSILEKTIHHLKLATTKIANTRMANTEERNFTEFPYRKIQ